jgi:hypothetical protein
MRLISVYANQIPQMVPVEYNRYEGVLTSSPHGINKIWWRLHCLHLCIAFHHCIFVYYLRRVLQLATSLGDSRFRELSLV